MQSPGEGVVPRSLMVELIELLGDFPPERNRPQSELLGAVWRIWNSEHARKGAAPETVAAIQGARVLLDLAELPPLPPANVTTG